MKTLDKNELHSWLRSTADSITTRSSLVASTEAAIERHESTVSAFVPGTLNLDSVRGWKPGSRESSPTPTFAGAPVAIKEIIAVDGMPRRAGSLLPPEAFDPTEASIVRRLRAIGCVPFAHSVSTEFAYFYPGPTRNPHNIEHSPGGSSSGSAAAVAAGMCPLAVGTQTIGSVIRPASFCGIVGYKPSFGALPRDGVHPVSRTVDHLGFFTQDLAGMASLARALGLVGRPIDSSGALDVRLCTGPYPEQASPAIRDLVGAVSQNLETDGRSVVTEPTFANIEEIDADHKRIMARDFYHAHSALYKSYGAQYRKHSREFFDEGAAVDVSAYEASLDAREREIARFDQLSNDGRRPVVWISPAAPGAAPHGIESTGSPLLNLPWTYVGAPVVTVPVGSDSVSGLPLGIQIAAPRGRDDLVFAAAQIITAATAGGDVR